MLPGSSKLLPSMVRNKLLMMVVGQVDPKLVPCGYLKPVPKVSRIDMMAGHNLMHVHATHVAHGWPFYLSHLGHPDHPCCLWFDPGKCCISA